MLESPEIDYDNTSLKYPSQPIPDPDLTPQESLIQPPPSEHDQPTKADIINRERRHSNIRKSWRYSKPIPAPKSPTKGAIEHLSRELQKVTSSNATREGFR